MVRFRSMKLLAIIVATTVFATGCGGSDSSTTDEAVSEDASEDTAAPAEDSGVTVCEGEPTREETLVVGPWQTYDAIPNPENFNMYKAIGGVNHQREIGLKGLYEALFVSNLNTGEEIPWLAESYEYNADFTEITVKMRAGTEWSDGVALTAEDVKFTLEMLRDNAPDLDYSSIYAEWLDSVTVPDPLTAIIKLKKSGPRWFNRNLALGHENHQVIMPKHIWEGQDPVTFTNFDLAKGWPVGSGPYKLVESSSRQQIMDRNNDWWGAKIGFKNLPAPCRVTMVPTGAEEPRGQMYQTNQIDYGLALQRKTLEAVMAANDKIQSWNAEGPVWGAADGCGQNFKFDLSQKPWDDINVRLAVNYAIDRQQLSDLGYASAYPGNDVPFSSYLSATWLTPEVKAVIAKYDRKTPSADKVAEYMGKSGYTKDSKGMWAKGGKTVKISVTGGSWIPLHPILAEQLVKGGFDATSNPDPDGSNVQTLDFLSAKSKTPNMLYVHCGSLAEPLDTLKDFHSNGSFPNDSGSCADGMACSRYSNPEYDKIVDDLLSRPGSVSDPVYMDGIVKLLDMYLRDMPELMLTEELWAITANNTYWTGWPNAADPYVAPYPCWEAWNQVLFKLKPAGK